MNTFSSEQFAYIKGEFPEFVAEISDFEYGALFEPLQDHGVGFKMVSERTGVIATFYFVNEKRDGEGDIMFWTFRPTLESVRQNPGLSRVCVVVFND